MPIRFLDEDQSQPTAPSKKGRIRFLDDPNVSAEKIEEKQPRSLRSAVVDQLKDPQNYSPLSFLQTIPEAASKLAGKAGEIASEYLGREQVNPYVSAGVGTFISMGPDIAMTASPELPASQAVKIAAVAGKKGVELAQKAVRFGIELTPAELTGSKNLSLIESALEKTPFSADIIRKFRIGQMEKLVKRREAILAENGPKETIEALGEQLKNQIDTVFNRETKLRTDTANKLKDSFLKRLGSSETYEEIGMAGQEAIKKASQVRFGKSQELYSQVDEYIDPNLTIEPKNLSKAAKEIMKSEGSLPQSLRDSESMSVLTDLAEGKPLNWSDLNSIRSRLGELIASSDPSYGFSKAAQGTKFVSDRSASTYKRLFGALEQDADDFMKAAGTEAENALTVARAFYKESKQLFGRADIQRVLKSDPEKVIGMVFKPGADTEIKMLRQGIGEESFAPLKKKFVSRLTETGEGEAITADVVRSRLDQYGETLKTIFSPQEINQFEDLIAGLQRADTRTVENPLFKSLLKQRPEKVIDYIVQPKNTSNIRAVQKELGNLGMEKVREGFLAKLLSEEKTGNFSPTRFSARLNTYGDETLKALFSKDLLDDLKTMAHIGEKMGKAEQLAGNPSGTAQNIVTWAGFAWAISHPASGIAILVSPTVLAKAYLSSPIRKLLTKGIELPKGTPEAGLVASRLLSYFSSKSGSDNK